MRVDPKSERELQEQNLLPAGEYDFEIIEAEETVSRAGNEMIKMRVKLYSDDHGERTLFDFLMNSIGHKLRHAAEACGMLENYQAGSLDAAEFVGKVGRCKVKIEPAKGEYAARNGISDYAINPPTGPSPKASARTKTPVPADLDDEIPF